MGIGLVLKKKKTYREARGETTKKRRKKRVDRRGVGMFRRGTLSKHRIKSETKGPKGKKVEYQKGHLYRPQNKMKGAKTRKEKKMGAKIPEKE